jgi:restriction system protein
MTIIKAIKKVMLKANKPLTHAEVYKLIISDKLYSFGAKDPKAVVGRTLRRHCYGLDFPSASPSKHFIVADTKTTKTQYLLWDKKEHRAVPRVDTDVEALPEEIINNRHKNHLSNIYNQLLDTIKQSAPAFFEKLVVDLLLKMGYGWDNTSAGEFCGGPGDGGIDGIIREDKLCLESIYIQAKRYRDKKVAPSEVLAFVGAMSTRGARKGVFISTTDFSVQAKRHAKEAQGMNITLLNGVELCELLVTNRLGVSEIENYSIYRINNDFFSDE